MLEKSGDLIPVRMEAVYIPWTKRKSQVLDFLHRGQVDFDTHVYDTNVGDISPLGVYFNPERWSVDDLNDKFGIQPQNSEPHPEKSEVSIEITHPKTGERMEVRSLCPRLLIYPERIKEEAVTSGMTSGLTSAAPSISVVPPTSDEQLQELLRFYDDPRSFEGRRDRGRLYSRGSSKSPQGQNEPESGLGTSACTSLTASNSASSLHGPARSSPTSSVSPSTTRSPPGFSRSATSISHETSPAFSAATSTASTSPAPSVPASNRVMISPSVFEEDGSNGAFLAVDPLEDATPAPMTSNLTLTSSAPPASAGAESSGVSFASALSSMADQLSSRSRKQSKMTLMGSDPNLDFFENRGRGQSQSRGHFGSSAFFRDRAASTNGIFDQDLTSRSNMTSNLTSNQFDLKGSLGSGLFGLDKTWTPHHYSEFDKDWVPRFIDFGTEAKGDSKVKPKVKVSEKDDAASPLLPSGLYLQETLV